VKVSLVQKAAVHQGYRGSLPDVRPSTRYVQASLSVAKNKPSFEPGQIVAINGLEKLFVLAQAYIL
jgi:hypothetical protein